MKKVLVILLVIAGIYGATSVFQEESSAHSHDRSTGTYSTDGGYYNSGYYYNSGASRYTYCNYCNGLKETSCDVCYGIGYKTIDVPDYGGVYQPDKKVDCSRCIDGDMDCPYC